MQLEEQFGMDKEQMQLLEYLWDRKFTLEVIGINSKLVFDWSKQGLLLDPEKPKKGRRKYSIVEFVWLKLVIKLREFGLSLDAIRNLREFLLEVFTFKQQVELFMSDEFLEELTDLEREKVLKDRELLNTFKSSIGEEDFQGTMEYSEFPEMKFMGTLLSYIIVDAVMNKKDIHLFITSSGGCYVSDSECGNELVASSDLTNEPYIKYPIRLLISEFVQQESMASTEELSEYKFLSNQEIKVLDLLRTENLVSLTVRIGKDNEIKLIETEENIRVDNVKGKLTDYIMRNNYQEISCKTQNGKITSIRRKTKHK
ncbi:MAG: MerR family transcriptional regulator [Crocinitomicaceae bacterium]|nr:MerR family transcriptional regulator [Crocinitomicaceae bacterium]